MQQDIISLLEKTKKPMSRSEIALKLNARETHVSLRINKLLKHNEVKCIEIGVEEAMKNYHCKRRLRLYYV